MTSTNYFIGWYLQVLIYWIFTIPLLCFLSAPVSTFSGYSWTLDTLTRVNPNDAFIGSYYFWWTNLTYLPSFYFLFLLFTFWVGGALGKQPSLAIICLSLLLLYTLELQDYLIVNAQDSVSFYSYYGINTLLTNVLNRYHPFVFYLSSVLLLAKVFSFCSAQVSSSYFNWVSSSLRSAFNPLWALLAINLVALWMGSWWALQEGTWGGWWNWDSSEMFGLIVSFAALSLHHFPWKNRLWSSVLVKSLLLISCFIISYFFIQLNFDLVSHNFGAKFFSLFNDNFFFAEVLFVSLFLSMFSLCILLRWVQNRKIFHLQRTRYSGLSQVHKFWLFTVSVSWTFWSYKPLMNYFLWNFAGLNVLNSEFSLQPLNFAAMLMLLIWLTKLNSDASLLAMSTPLLVSNWIFLPLSYLGNFSLYSSTHYTLLLLAATNLVLYDLTLTYWVSFTSFDFFYADTYTYLLCQKEWVLDTNLFDSIGLWLGLDGTYFVMWNTFLNSNAPAINFFLLVFSHASFENLYLLGSSYSTPALFIELPSISSLNLFFLSLLLISQRLVWFKRSHTNL